MTDTLFQAYAPLLFWTGLGIFVCRFLPESFPRFLGRSLYWVGIPLEIFALARQTEFAQQASLAPVVTIATLLGGLGLAGLTLQGIRQAHPPKAVDEKKEAESEKEFEARTETEREKEPEAKRAPTIAPYWQQRPWQGSFLISSVLGNTGFVGLAIAPVFVGSSAQSWLVLYSVTQNIVGTYGMGVFVASYFGRPAQNHRGWTQIRDVLTVPSLWAFAMSTATRSIVLPPILEAGLHASIGLVIPAALGLMGMRLSQIRGWQTLRRAIAPTLLKALVVPCLVGVLTTWGGIDGDPRLALVLMAGMPTAFAGLILAEEYELDRDLIASSIVLTTGTLLFTIPLWLVLFGQGIP
ncbi:MAG: AEC family transporter [Leptolyngbyaceae cyanobacterium CSU_1_4]|nr:AEC family transporter [Leptolyngbyaceae cyanobacterium CSU_1_4]